MALDYRGINISGLEFGNGARPYFDYAVPGKEQYEYWGGDVGANVVRIPFKWERLQTTPGGDLDKQYLDFLKGSVEHAKANGMTAILDMHNYSNYAGHKLTDATKLTDVWTKLGNVFKGDPSVWLNLMNEPNGISATAWENITQATVNNLRAEGIDNKLLLSGTAWSGAHSWMSSGNAAAYAGFTDPANNYAFDVHQYLDKYSSGMTAVTEPGIGQNSLKAITEWAEKNGHQLFLGEVGAADPTLPGQGNALTELNDLMTFMDAHAQTWLGFTLWGAGPWWPENYIFNINPDGIKSADPVHSNIIDSIMNWFKPPAAELPPLPEPELPVDLPVPVPDASPIAVIPVVAGKILTGDAMDNVLQGADGADTLTGGGGRDILKGGTGNDILYGDGAPGDASVAGLLSVAHDFSAKHGAYKTIAKVSQTAPELGLAKEDMAITQKTTFDVTFAKGTAGYHSTVGIYSVAADGTIGGVSVVFKNVKTIKDGTSTSVILDGGDGMQAGFFILANGYSLNGKYNVTALGDLHMIYHYGKADERAAKITDLPKDISLIDKGGLHPVILKGDMFHTTYSGEKASLNVDNIIHVQTGLAGGDHNTLRVGFEDMKGGGDRDFDDIVIDVRMTTYTRDTSYDDTLFGDGGNDVLFGGAGHDVLTGGEGKDTFLYTAMSEAGDTITDFQTGTGGDIIDLHAVLEHYDAMTSHISDFIKFVTGGGGERILAVNADGDLGGAFTNLATLLGVAPDISVEAMVASGNLVV